MAWPPAQLLPAEGEGEGGPHLATPSFQLPLGSWVPAAPFLWPPLQVPAPSLWPSGSVLCLPPLQPSRAAPLGMGAQGGFGDSGTHW